MRERAHRIGFPDRQSEHAKAGDAAAPTLDQGRCDPEPPAALLSTNGDSDDGKTQRADEGTPTTSAKPAADAKDRTYEVSVEVGGKGKPSVYYNLNTNRSEQVTLPWKKSDKLRLNGTECKVGITVSVVPGPVRLSNG
jgi:hypothetical protein